MTVMLKKMLFVPALVLALGSFPAAQQRRPLSAANITDIATLLKLEDTRQFDEAVLSRVLDSAHPEVRRRAAITVGRLADPRGGGLLQKARADRDVEVAASAVWSAGQLRQGDAVGWVSEMLRGPLTPAVVRREAAQALGKIQTPESRAALAEYLIKAPATPAQAAAVGEALLSIGRFTGKNDMAPIVRWVSSPNVEVRWRAAWALFRPRDPAALPNLRKLAADPSAEVRYWAVRGLLPAVADAAGTPRADITSQLRMLVLKDPDRRVRTEALRAILQYDDENAFGALINALDSTDTWMSVSAAEAAARFTSRMGVVIPMVVEISGEKKPLSQRIAALGALVTLKPLVALDMAVALAHNDSAAARSAAFSALGRLGEPGQAGLKQLQNDPSMAGKLPPQGGRAAGGGGGGGRSGTMAREARPDAEYRALVEKYIVPAYNGAPAPRAIWETPRGAIEIELYPGDAPFGVEHFVRVVESGDIVGTEFTRLVPDFVAQQQATRNASTLRDEVNRRGLTRGNLSWASAAAPTPSAPRAGLDTGRPGYTLGHTPQPHNEGNFTSLGRVVRGMDVVDRLELGDKVTGAKMIRK